MLIRIVCPAITSRGVPLRGLLLVASVGTAMVVVGCNSTEKQVNSGVSAVKSGDYDQALKILVPLAERGESRAAVEVGNMYALGWGVPADDSVADDWFRKAETLGVPPGRSQLDIAFELAAGRGMKRDPARAQLWLEKSAKLGYDKASALLQNADELKQKGFTSEQSNGD